MKIDLDKNKNVRILKYFDVQQKHDAKLSVRVIHTFYFFVTKIFFTRDNNK